MRLPIRAKWLPLLAAISVAGCATYPDNVSYLYGERYHRTKMRTYPTIVTAIDGRSTALNPAPVPIESGPRVLRLSTAPVTGFGFPQERELQLVVEPCKRYHIVAERDNALLQDWRPVIDHVEPASGGSCK